MYLNKLNGYFVYPQRQRFLDCRLTNHRTHFLYLGLFTNHLVPNKPPSKSIALRKPRNSAQITDGVVINIKHERLYRCASIKTRAKREVTDRPDERCIISFQCDAKSRIKCERRDAWVAGAVYLVRCFPDELQNATAEASDDCLTQSELEIFCVRECVGE